MRPTSWPRPSPRTRPPADPFFVVATVGTTSSLAVDPVAAIAQICTAGVWLHVDGDGRLGCDLPELRWIHDGVERADSYGFNPHKWLFTNFDCDVLLGGRTARPCSAPCRSSPSTCATQASESGAVIDYRDWQVPLGRRFRALKLWFVLRQYGAEGLRPPRSARHVALAERCRVVGRGGRRFELAAPPPSASSASATAAATRSTRHHGRRQRLRASRT